MDHRNNIELQNQIFAGVFNVKRLQPGKVGEREEVKSFANVVPSVTHDCSTLGGNSGSAVIDVETGAVLALHFAGRYLEANYAVPASALSLDGRVADAGVGFYEGARPARTDWDDRWELADPPPTKRVESTPARPVADIPTAGTVG